MKKVFLSIMLAGLFLFGAAQALQQPLTEGVINYQEIIKLEIQLEGEAAQMSHLFPKEKKTNKVLYFNASTTLYENGTSTETPEAITPDEGKVVIKMMEPDNKLFTDLANNMQIEQREFMNRLFLINKDLDSNKWKLTGNQKVILDFPCQEAITKDTSKQITVWFTSVIPVGSGPGEFGGLPGMVLAVEAGDGTFSLIATKVEAKDLAAETFVKPKKGKKVSKEDFDKIVEAKMKESGASGSGGHQIVIKIEQD